ncbi:MAG TPA: hypothetical protein VGM67_14465 [Gemmatimonadaceae bacterium]|jgi:hypothetical protein
MSDDRMDDLLRDGVRDYNAPGPVPREAMWARIEEARKSHAADARTSLVAVPMRRGRMWVWPTAGVAAALLVAAGIVIGRRMERSDRPTTNRPSTVAQTSPAHSGSESSAAMPASSTPAGSASPATSTLAAAPAVVASPDAERPTSNTNLAYRLAVLQHLAGTEAMITSFRQTASRGEPDTLMMAWSREMLSTTRMLADSPANTDPVMKHLLQDLDFVITEIVNYSAHGVNNPEELKLIEQSINERSVIPKLRGTLPRRSPSAGL